MDDAWPPPSKDDLPYGGDRAPNYRRRRLVVATAAAVSVALVAAGSYLVLGGDDDDAADSGGAADSWDVVVVQQPSGTVTVHDRSGDEIASAETDLVGVADVGLAGAVVLGLEGSPAEDGLGLLDLDDASITRLDVSFGDVRRLGRSALLLASEAAGVGLELVVTADARTLDLAALADGENPLFDPASARVDDAGTFVAFNELRSSETVVVDVAAGTGASLPGSLVDLAFERVLTITNRGDTVLLDLSEAGGERVGTVETAPVRAAMLVDAATALIVTADGVVSSVDFEEEAVDEVTLLAPLLPVPPGADPAVDTDIVAGGLALGDRSRMALFGERFVAFVDAAGTLVRSVDVPMRQLPWLEPTGADRCLSVGQPGGPYTLLDSTTGAIVTAFGEGVLVADSADGCRVAFAASGTGVDVVAGLDVDRRVDEPVLTLSADGSAVVQGSVRSTTWVDLGTPSDSASGEGDEAGGAADDEPVELIARRATGAAFART